ncbi:predicted protein, partial [Nematostella vectensis]
MYHEADYEMEQLLNSLHDVDRYRRKARRHIESHVFFDGCIKSDELNSYILQLVSLVESTLRIPLNKCTKMKTPYGMQLRWKLPGGMPFTIHLKDNNKVKNKKRWSQVMYMSYVPHSFFYLFNEMYFCLVRDDQTFILTTDADVNFKHESMEALIDYMLQDEKVGAVCGRTHPMGKGPLVWYQIFDYAIGHWFQKVANHMLGSVLCCPGCFSLYRCKAVKDILPEYSTNVNEASEFLTKDMGEDRWMCTLMVQAGWRLLYCAAAEDVTYCPTTFDEFYNQRRRWMPSTLANLILLISEWRLVVTNNDYISVPFIIFQLILLLATVIGPSTVILVITGGMNYVGIATNEVTTVTIMSLITLAFGLICLFTSQSFQLLIAKLLTFAFSIVMLMVAVGVAVQISKDLEKREAARNSLNSTSTSELVVLPASVSTLYLGGIFVLAALLHPKEAYCLLNGIFYLLCLPSGYLLLTVYSIVNITDRSWGKSLLPFSAPTDNPNHLAPRCACHPLQKPDDDYLGRARTNRSRSLDDIDSPQVINLRDIHCNLGTWDARFGFQQQIKKEAKVVADGVSFDFWEGLRRISLEPEAAAFSTSSELKEKLTSLRNSVLVIFFVANVLWMLLIMVLARHQSLKVLGVDVIGLGFLIVYGVIIIVQFLTMVCHRLATMIHVLARA